MYLILGFDSQDKETARLEYPTLDEAMQKLRDLVEADEIDNDGPMFTRYGLMMDPLPVGRKEEGPELRLAD